MKERGSFTYAPKVAFLATFIPKKCGIATYTYDLYSAYKKRYKSNPIVVAMKDDTIEYTDSSDINYVIRKGEIEDYKSAADYLNAQNINILHIQHEYGIFGGKNGRYLLMLLDNLDPRIKIIVTFHTMILSPKPYMKRVTEQILKKAAISTVMMDKAKKILMNQYGVKSNKVIVIPHGVPDIRENDILKSKRKLKLIKNKVILSINLLSRNKGIEYIIRALPTVIKKFPETIFLLVGETHPNVKIKEGEKYREYLFRLARKLKVEKNIYQLDRYITHSELVDYLRACDIYITAYLDPKQVSSGNLAYAVAAGKAVISTPYFYAKILLRENRGRLVKFKDSLSIARAIISTFSNPSKTKQMTQRAYKYGRKMVWPQVALEHYKIYSRFF